jgi:hypothetical protein
MSDLREYEAPESEIGNTGKIVDAPETALSGLRGYEKIDGAPETETDDLRGYQQPEEETGTAKAKIIGAVAVALMIGAAGAYTFATGAWNSPPKQVLASLVPPSTSLPPSVAPMQHTVVPQLAPVENAPAEMSPQATAVSPVRAARTHVSSRARSHAPTVQPSGNFSEQASPAFVPAAASVPAQPAPLDTIIVAPAITPPPDTSLQPVAVQPALTVPVQPTQQP